MPAVAQPRSQHPPLAHDARGFPIALPDGTASLGVKRQTTGRPKVVLGPNRQPLRLPLDSTTSDLLDLCGAGSFRIDAIDEAGQPLDFITTVTVGDGCTADAVESDPLSTPLVPRAVSGGGSELRFALEVTAHMARAQSEALRSIASAQADWIKGLASAKVLHHRNGMWPALPVPTTASDEEHDGESDEDDDSGGADPSMTALGHIASIAKEVGPVLQAMIPKKIADHRNAAPTTDAPPTTTAAVAEPDVATPSIRIAIVLAQVSPEARALACRVLARNDQRARDIATALQTLPVAEAVAQLEAAIDGRAPSARARNGAAAPAAAPPVDATVHLAAVMARLAPEEIARAQALLATLEPARMEQLKRELLAMSPDDAAASVRKALRDQEGGHVGA
jgi:hypothetical protein